MNTKEQYIISLIKSKIKKKDSKAEVILFGSHDRGDAQIDSDWDILILLDSLKVSRKTEKEYREELLTLNWKLVNLSQLFYIQKMTGSLVIQ